MKLYQSIKGEFSSFIKHVLTLSIGSLIGQSLGFLALPILSRIYDPHEFGIFYTFLGFSQTFGLISTLKYEKSIILPDDEKEANTQFVLTILITLIYSILLLLLFLLLYLFQEDIKSLGSKLLLVPVCILVYAVNSVVVLYFQRSQKFKTISYMSILQSTFVIVFSILFSFVSNNGLGLIGGYILGGLSIVVLVFFSNLDTFKPTFIGVSKNKLIQGFKKYINFPKYYLLFDLLSSGTVYVIPILITTYFGVDENGYYSMPLKMMMAPVVLIAQSVSMVFLVLARKENKEKGSFNKVLIDIFIKLSIIGLFIYTFMFFFGNWVLLLVLGKTWAGIGVYVKIIAVLIFFEFIFTPFKTNVFIITNNQKLALKIQIFRSVFIVGTFFLTNNMGILTTLSIYVVFSVLFGAINFWFAYFLSMKGDDNLEFEKVETTIIE